ncbi:MAG: LLM class flavin-dependent oxidoreductase [Nitrososphaerota archaeon]|nr:LLM class flavin-dependent oxidoreductase [Nitrososphaerota archaeon]MDG6921766.1 LLM class flavin-dependent oxidoreductase [Nitrososphaerota archaeon]
MNEVTNQDFFTADTVSNLPLRERVGFSVEGRDARDALNQICEAEDLGVGQAWMTMAGAGRTDPLTFYAAAAAQTAKIRLGTAIVPAYPRHPLVTAQQALAIDDLAPNRLRLGVGTSHRQIIEDSFGIKMGQPLSYLCEYVSVLRGALVDGSVSHHGKFFDVEFSSQRRARVPVLVAALGEKAFRNAGGIADGIISWLCPSSYLTSTALPAIREGAKGRTVPPLVAHVMVALSRDKSAVRATGSKRLGFYAGSPFYVNMFRAAGLPIVKNTVDPGKLADSLIVSGEEDEVKEKIVELLKRLDELLIGLVPVSSDANGERKKLLRLIGELR